MKKAIKSEAGKNLQTFTGILSAEYPACPAPRDFSCSQVTTDTVQLHNNGLDCWEKSCMRKKVRRGLVGPSLLRSCLQFPALSLDPCQGSLTMPGHVPQRSSLDLDSLICFHSLDVHLSHHHRFVWQPLDCWLTLIAISRLAVLWFGFYGIGPLLVQSQPCTCL